MFFSTCDGGDVPARNAQLVTKCAETPHRFQFLCSNLWCSMSKVALYNSRYTYSHENKRGFHEAIDVHEIIISKYKGRSFFSFFCILLSLLHVYHFFGVKERLGVYIFGTLFLSVFIAKLWQSKAVKKESVLILPSFGVQLETHYWSGRVTRHFVSIGKILKPVLSEVVTPVTCYWSLSLILRGEEKLMLVFQESHPPVKMLVPIWKALCAATNGENDLEESGFVKSEL